MRSLMLGVESRAPGSSAGAASSEVQAGSVSSDLLPAGVTEKVDNLLQTTLSVSRPDVLAHPDTLTASLGGLSGFWGLTLVILGLLCLVNGYRFYKVATLASMLAIGSVTGFWLGLQIDAPKIVIAACLGILLAVVAFPLMKYAVAALAGLSGAFLGANLWAGLAAAANQAQLRKMHPNLASAQVTDTMRAAAEVVPAEQFWIGALIGLVVCGMLAFILFKLSIVLYTSVCGATLLVMGGIALLLDVEQTRETVAGGLESHALVVPLLVLVPAVVGLILQERRRDESGGGGAPKPA